MTTYLINHLCIGKTWPPELSPPWPDMVTEAGDALGAWVQRRDGEIPGEQA